MTASGKDRFARSTERKAVATASGKDRFAQLTERKAFATTFGSCCFEPAKRLRPLAVITALHAKLPRRSGNMCTTVQVLD